MSNDSIPPFLPLNYASLSRACRLLECEEEDLFHWIETGSIQLNVNLGEGERSIIKEGSSSTLSFFLRKNDLPPIDTKKNPVLHLAEASSTKSLVFGSHLSTYYSVLTVDMTVMQEMPSLYGCPTRIPPSERGKTSKVSYLCAEPGIAFFSRVYPVGIWHLQQVLGYEIQTVLRSLLESPINVTCLLTPEM